MPRMHDRDQAVRMAEAEVTLAVHKVVNRVDLTPTEYMSVLTGAFSSLMSGFLKYQLRFDRHGDFESSAGWATEPDAPQVAVEAVDGSAVMLDRKLWLSRPGRDYLWDPASAEWRESSDSEDDDDEDESGPDDIRGYEIG